MSRRTQQAFTASFPSPPPPPFTRLLFSGGTQAFTYKSPTVSHSQVPILSSVCLLRCPHNAGINSSKPIWASAKSRTFVLGKFPLHTSLEVDCSPLLCRWLWSSHGAEGRTEDEKRLLAQLGITSYWGVVCFPVSLFQSCWSLSGLMCPLPWQQFTLL